jgi:hypothetical protein
MRMISPARLQPEKALRWDQRQLSKHLWNCRISLIQAKVSDQVNLKGELLIGQTHCRMVSKSLVRLDLSH